MSFEPILQRARELLILSTPGGGSDLALWEHSVRAMHAAHALAQAPEIRQREPDLVSCTTAALFHDAGWAVQFRQGVVTHAQVLTRPTSQVQRELGAGAMAEVLADVLPADTLELVAEAIRHAGTHQTALVEAQIVSDAANLDDIGVTHLLRQYRQYHAEGRQLEQLRTTWMRQSEYRFWDARINDGLRFEFTRGLARARLRAVEQFMVALATELEAGDLRRELRELGVQPIALE